MAPCLQPHIPANMDGVQRKASASGHTEASAVSQPYVGWQTVAVRYGELPFALDVRAQMLPAYLVHVCSQVSATQGLELVLSIICNAWAQLGLRCLRRCCTASVLAISRPGSRWRWPCVTSTAI